MRLSLRLVAAALACHPRSAAAQIGPPAVPAGTRIFVTPIAESPAIEGRDTKHLRLDTLKRIEREGDPDWRDTAFPR